MKPRTIVSVLESSPAGNDAALTRALSLARWYESDLHVVHVRPSRRNGEDGADAVHEALDERLSRGARAAGAAGVIITPTRLAGSAVPAVAGYAGRVSADLVVVGTEPRPGDGYWSAGSFAAALGAAVSAPTMAIASEAAAPVVPATPFGSILAAVDLSEVSLRALSEAIALTRESGGRLTVLHVLGDYAYDASYSGVWALSLLDELDAKVTAAGNELRSLVPAELVDRCDIDVVTVPESPADAIVGAAVEASADLIVMGLPRHRRLDRLVAGSTAHKVVRRATAPVLLVPGAAATAGAGGWLARRPALRVSLAAARS